MIKKNVGIIPLAAIFLAFSVNAEVKLKNNSEILGKWKVTAESSTLDGKKTEVNMEWDFANDGILHTKATDTRGRTKEMNIEVKYYVEDGAIHKEIPSRRGKFETCNVVDKNDTSMIIKCTYNYFFLTKK